MTSAQIRQQFLDFFVGKGHTVVGSAPVVPHDDPTLLFTNAGMNQFKDVFLGSGSRTYSRAADTQKCIRAGGKHNDLDDVGKDTYHHTFFEMLGNWSFGDYFKEEAIRWAWELLTGVWGIDKSRLYATYFEGDAAIGLEPDLEAADLWKSVTDIDPSHIIPGDRKDNFWEMGDTGPCGPCSEIHIDLTADKSGGSRVNADDPSVIEIWNLVFIQFNRVSAEALHPLPAKHVDTGMGFERICTVLQGKLSNYDTDVFTPLFEAIQKRTGAPVYGGLLESDSQGAGDDHDALMRDVSYRIIADHLRCLTFALTDGAVPSNEGRGYVLRRILRRAVRYGRQYFKMTEPFLCDLVEPLAMQLGDVFPELRQANQGKNVEHVVELIRDEEVSFGRTLDRGIKLFELAAERAVDSRILGEDAFSLHDTFGFPVDLTELMARERGLSVDIAKYEALMDEARRRAQATGGTSDAFNLNIVDTLPPTDDSSKYVETSIPARLMGYVHAGHFCEEGDVPLGETVALVTDATCFYGEQGGQVGDTGTIEARGESPGAFDVPGFRVSDTKRFGETVLHIGELVSSEFSLVVGAEVQLTVDAPQREQITQNHTATHLLNWALREVLGPAVDQKGSLVDPEKTRFDFSHKKPIATDELESIGQWVERKIADNLPVHTKEVTEQASREITTLRAVFGEKYPDRVRVVSIGADIDKMMNTPKDANWMAYSVEYCGGIHVQSTGEIGRFVLTGEEGVAKGIRRLVGLTGERASDAVRAGATLTQEIDALAGRIKKGERDALGPVQQRLADSVIPISVRHRLREQLADLQKQLKKSEKASSSSFAQETSDRLDALMSDAPTVGGITIVVGELPDAHGDALRTAVDRIRQKTEASAVLLATCNGGRVTLVAGMSKAAVDRGLRAGDLIREIAPLVGGKGGGRPDMAQGGGDDASGIPEAVAASNAWLQGKLTA
ncbi:MAG: alanine--tRNA ligase [Planctomycetes bacterium]|nr:alanine--tRNA ligase [Planctomycetota bacterium]